MEKESNFEALYTKIANLCFMGTKMDMDCLISALDELNFLNYRYTSTQKPTKFLFLVTHLCSAIPAEDSVLVDKCSQFIMNLIRFQHVSFEGSTLTTSVDWCLRVMKCMKGNILLRVLEILEALVKQDSTNSVVHENVIKEIQKLLGTNNVPPELILTCLQCLEACVSPNGSKSVNTNFLVHLDICGDVFINYLLNRHNFDALVCSKILGVCLIGLQNVVLQSPKLLQNKLEILLGIVKSYMLYGLPEISFLLPQQMKPSTLMVPDIPDDNLKTQRGIRGKKTVKHRALASQNKGQKETSESFGFSREYLHSVDVGSDNMKTALNSSCKTSDSDFSDSEGGKLARISHFNAKIRQAALSLFYIINKQCDKSVLFAYWTSFLPEVQTSGKHNLYTSILKDSSSRCRLGALNVVSQLLVAFKSYLKLAEYSERSTSFTSFSTVLSLILIELHKVLCLAMSDSSTIVVTQVLKCLATLVQATPYHKMPKALVAKISRNVKVFIFSRDSSVQVTALIVMGCLVASEPTTPEILRCITNIESIEKQADSRENSAHHEEKDDDDDSASDFDFAQFSDDDDINLNPGTHGPMSWLLKKCLSNLGVQLSNSVSELSPVPAKLESLQIISTMSQTYFKQLVQPHLNVVFTALRSCLLDDSTDSVPLHAARAVDCIGQAINRQFDDSLKDDCPKEPLSLQNSIEFWEGLLSGPLDGLFQNEHHSILRSVGCDCLASIGPHIFQNLLRSKQILCMTLLFNCAKDNEKAAKGSAIRSLGVCVLYPTLRDDMGFIMDTAEIILDCLKDDNSTVRMKASWSLGNLSDALLFNMKSADPVEEEFPDNILYELLSASIKASNDQDKIKMNGVRALGSFFIAMNEKHLDNTKIKNRCEEGILSLIKSCSTGSNAKVRWNACYALGRTLQNEVIYKKTDVSKWHPNIFTALTDLVIGHNNFKVRINAANALACPVKREHYGSYYVTTWSALLKALENSQNIVNFTEYKHRDHLIEQICTGLAHLTTHLTLADLIHIREVLDLYFDIYQTFVHKQLETLLPEKTTSFFSAACRLNDLKMTNSLGSTEEQTIRQLLDIFTLDLKAV